jgi:hypothetical protein
MPCAQTAWKHCRISRAGLSLGNRQIIVDFAAVHRMPAIYQARVFVAAGGLMAWAPDQTEQLAHRGAHGGAHPARRESG